MLDAKCARSVPTIQRSMRCGDTNYAVPDGPCRPISYIKTMDLQSKLVCRNIWGPLALRIVSFLMVSHRTSARPTHAAVTRGALSTIHLGACACPRCC